MENAIVTLYRVQQWHLPWDSPSMSVRTVGALTEIQTNHLPNSIQLAWYSLQMNMQMNEEVNGWIYKNWYWFQGELQDMQNSLQCMTMSGIPFYLVFTA